MKILIFPMGSSGDINPLVGLSLALRRRGHRPVMFVNGYYRQLLDSTGLEWHEFTTREQYLELANHPDLWDPRRSFAHVFGRGVLRLMRPQYEQISAHFQPGQTLVLANCFGFGARVAQEKLGVPLITVHLQPAVLWSQFDSPALPNMLVEPPTPRWFKRFQYWAAQKFFVDPVTRPETNRFRAELGLPPFARTFDWWNSPQGVLGLFPAWYAAPQPDWPAQVRLADFPLWDHDTSEASDQQHQALEEFLAAGEPPVVFTPGTGNLLAARFFTAAVDACRLLPCRGLLLSRFDEQIPAVLPEGVRHFRYVPFSRLLPRCRAIVHHGGIGTCAQALQAGIPQLIMPLSHDQPDNAARLGRLGVARTVWPRSFRGPEVARQLRDLLDLPTTARQCRELAARMPGDDSFASACQIIDELGTPLLAG